MTIEQLNYGKDLLKKIDKLKSISDGVIASIKELFGNEGEMAKLPTGLIISVTNAFKQQIDELQKKFAGL